MEGIEIYKNLKWILLILVLTVSFNGCWWDDEDNPEYIEKKIKAGVVSNFEVQHGNRVVLNIDKQEYGIESVISENGEVTEKDSSGNYFYDVPFTGNSDKITVNYSDTEGKIYTTEYGVTLKNRVTFMLYLATENSLGTAEFHIDDLNEIANAVIEKNNRNINVVVYIDTNPVYVTIDGEKVESEEKTGNGCYVYTGEKSDTITVNSITISGFKKTGYYGSGNTGIADELTGFINYAKENFQSEKYILDIWSHGDGWRESQYSKSIKERAIVDDKGDKSSLDMWEVESAIKNSEIPKIDIVYMDACLMGGIEVGYQLKDCADYLVFSPELTPGYGGYYTGIIEKLNSSSFDSKIMSCLIAQENGEFYTKFIVPISSTIKYRYSYVFSVADQSKVEALSEAFRGVTDELLKSENSLIMEKIRGLNDRSTGSSSVLCYDESSNPYSNDATTLYDSMNEESIYVDMGDLLIKIKEMTANTEHSSLLEEKIDSGLAALQNYIVFKKYGDGIYWKNGERMGKEIESGTTGLSVYVDLLYLSGEVEYSEYKTATTFGGFEWYQNFLNDIYGL